MKRRVQGKEHGEREREILRILTRGEREIAQGRGRTLDSVLADADRLLRDAGASKSE